MCGKITAMLSWSEIVEFSTLLESGGEEDAGGSNDEIATYSVNGMLPVIVWDAEAQQRRVVPMRWGFPHPKDLRRPQPIHARSETVEAIEPFRGAFHEGQRGIVVFRTFNEGEEVLKPSGKRQWTVDPRDGRPRGFAFVWRRFEIPDLPAPILACVMAQDDDPRMPAILEDDAWSTWLGEDGASPVAAKADLRTMEGVNWQAAPEPKKPRRRRP